VGLISPPRNELAILPAGVVPGTRGALAIRTNNNKRSLYSARDRIRPAYPVAFEDRPHSAFVNVITPNIRLIASKSYTKEELIGGRCPINVAHRQRSPRTGWRSLTISLPAAEHDLINRG
jgi:hypothetical protein